MTLWWLQEGWTEARCGRCGAKIWPEGDPDWGLCLECMNYEYDSRHQEEVEMYPCDICGKNAAVAGVNGYGVCSELCDMEASLRAPKKE